MSKGLKMKDKVIIMNFCTATYRVKAFNGEHAIYGILLSYWRSIYGR